MARNVAGINIADIDIECKIIGKYKPTLTVVGFENICKSNTNINEKTTAFVVVITISRRNIDFRSLICSAIKNSAVPKVESEAAKFAIRITTA
jgi:hypothetical protein